MDEEIKEELQDIREIVAENHAMLKKIQRRAKMGIVLRTVYWAVIIGIAAGAFYFLQPYVEQGKSMIQSLRETQEKLGEAGKSLFGK
jgi:hypothetical protein